MRKIKSDTCRRSCSPSDFYKGGKCDLNGCYDGKSEHIEDLIKEARKKNKNIQ